MTITSTTVRTAYAGDDVSTTFTVPFAFWGPDELQVMTQTGNTITTLARAVDYTVFGGSGSTGSITTTTAPATDTTLILRRATARTQQAAYTDFDPFPAQTHQTAIDRAIASIQETDESVTRSVRGPTGEAPMAVLPVAAARAGMLLGFDGAGAPILMALDAYTPTGSNLLFNVIQNFSGDSVRFSLSQDVVASSTTLGEVVAHFGMVSSTGGTNPLTAWKGGLTTNVTLLPGSASGWGMVCVLNMEPGLSSSIGGIGLELDANYLNADYSSTGYPYAVNLYMTGTASVGTKGLAFVVKGNGSGTTPLVTYGELIVTYGAAKLASNATWADLSNGTPVAIQIAGTGRVNGIDITGATLAGGSALVCGNNQNVSFLDNGGTPRVAVAVDISNNLVLGASALNQITVNQKVLPGADNTYAMGSGSFRYSTIYLATAAVVSSDPELKTEMVVIAPAYARSFVRAVDGYTFKFKVGGQEEYTEIEEIEVQATEDYTEIDGRVEIVDGRATWVETPVIKQRLIFDEELVWNQDGTAAMETIPRRPEIKREDGSIVREEVPKRAVQRVRFVPRMVTQPTPVTKLRPVAGRRRHVGFDAAQVAKAIPPDDNLAIYVVDPDGGKHLRMEQIIPMLHVLVKDHDDEIDALKKNVAQLAARLSALEARL